MTRRRLLSDTLSLGAVLLGSALLARPEPFFDQFLETQRPHKPAAAGPVEPTTVTRAFPSDEDTDTPPDCTERYPSDTDLPEPVGSAPRDPVDCTEAYPSDTDCHEPRLVTCAEYNDQDSPSMRVTCAYPSDDDTHEPRPAPASGSRAPRESGMLPFWARLS